MILLYHYTDGQPFIKFPSTLQAALWLRSVGCLYVGRKGDNLLFKL